jgi:hypothetical protein
MKRTLLIQSILTGLLLGMAVLAAGGAGDAEKVSLAALKTDLLRKMVAAHAGDKTLPDLGEAKAVAGRLTYAFKDGKPSVVLDQTKLDKDVSPAGRDASLAALRGLLESSLNKAADGGVAEGDKKYTLAKADVKTLADSARILWRAGPPPADATKALAARLDALAKEIDTLKKLEARLAKVEKDGPALQKLEKALQKLDALPAQVKALEGKAKAAEDQAKALTDRAGKLEKALADATAALDKQGKAHGALEKQVKDATAALEKHGKDAAAALKKQADATAALKKQADDTAAALEKQGKAHAALEKQIGEARAALEKQNKETLTALEKQNKETLAASKKQADAAALALAKQKEELTAAFDKQGKANTAALAKQAEAGLAAMKKVSAEVAAAQKKLAAIEARVTKDAEWKKVEERLARIEAILFPPPPPVIPCEVAEQGYYLMTTTWKHGCFGRLFPSKAMTWVPCPAPAP